MSGNSRRDISSALLCAVLLIPCVMGTTRSQLTGQETAKPGYQRTIELIREAIKQLADAEKPHDDDILSILGDASDQVLDEVGQYETKFTFWAEQLSKGIDRAVHPSQAEVDAQWRETVDFAMSQLPGNATLIYDAAQELSQGLGGPDVEWLSLIEARYKDMSERYKEWIRLKRVQNLTVKNGQKRTPSPARGTRRSRELTHLIQVPKELREWTPATADAGAPPSLIARPGLMPDDLEESYGRFMDHGKDSEFFSEMERSLGIAVEGDLARWRELTTEVEKTISERNNWARAVSIDRGGAFMAQFAQAYGNLTMANWSGRMTAPAAGSAPRQTYAARRPVPRTRYRGPSGTPSKIFDGARF
jgi:hypothetical protein